MKKSFQACSRSPGSPCWPRSSAPRRHRARSWPAWTAGIRDHRVLRAHDRSGRLDRRRAAWVLDPVRTAVECRRQEADDEDQEGDTKFDPAVTSTVAQRFASDGNVIGVIGPGASQEVLAAGPILKKAGLPYVAASAIATTDQGLASDVPAHRRAGQAPGRLFGQVHEVEAAREVGPCGRRPVGGREAARGPGRQAPQRAGRQGQTGVGDTEDVGLLVRDHLDAGDIDPVYMALQLPDKMTLFGNQLKEQGKRQGVPERRGGRREAAGAYFSTFGPDVTHLRRGRSSGRTTRYGARRP